MRHGYGGGGGYGYDPSAAMGPGMPASYQTYGPMSGGGSMFQRRLLGIDPLYDPADQPPPLQGTDPGKLGGGLGFTPPTRRY